MLKKLILLLIIIFVITPNIVWAEMGESIPEEYAKGEVLEILEEEKGIDYGAGIKVDYQRLKVKILSGLYKNKIIEVENTTSGNPAYDIWVKKGDKVLLVLENIDSNTINGYIADFQRDNYVFLLILLFILLLILIGRKQGMKSIITLSLTILIIAKVMLPLLLKGYNPVILALLTGILVTAITLVFIGGLSKKTVSAIIGTAGGLISAAIAAIIVGKLANLKGLSNEEAQMLLYIPQNINFDFRGLLFSGIIIGALGAVMDVSMSIASSMEEISNVGSSLKFKELFNSGMNVGKDIMGTMSNTLILAYTGTSIPLLLLFMAYKQPFIKLINLDFLASEFIRALSGSIGLILSIPITALVAGYLMSKK